MSTPSGASFGEPSNQSAGAEPAQPTGRTPGPATAAVMSTSLLARGVGLLLVSLILVVVIAGLQAGGTRTRVVLSWCEQAAFWLGIVCIAGDVLAEVLGRRNR